MQNIDSLLNLDQVSNDLKNGGFESLLDDYEKLIDEAIENMTK